MYYLIFAMVSHFSYAIIGGVVANKMTSKILKMQVLQNGQRLGGVCSGVLIKDKTVLSAAHCLKQVDLNDISGVIIKINNENYSPELISFKKSFFELQKKFDDKKGISIKTISQVDIVRITLSKSIPDALITSIGISKNGPVQVCGYGHDQYSARDGFSGNTESPKLLCTFNNAVFEQGKLFIAGSFIKALTTKGLTAPGDSGAPLINQDGELVGILSGVIRRADSTGFSYFASTDNLSFDYNIKSKRLRYKAPTQKSLQ